MKRCFRVIAPMWLLAAISLGIAPTVFADVALAGRDADRQAKVAAPATNEALIYVYRNDDANNNPIAVTFSGRETVYLAPRTFAWWVTKPGRSELTIERSASTVPLQTEGGHVYYVEAGRTGAGVATLRRVSFATGRTQVHRSQLVAQSTSPVRDRTAAPAPSYARSNPRAAISVKLGSYKLAETAQTVLSLDRTFEGSSSSVYAIEGEIFLRPDITLGLEYVRFSNDYSTVSTLGTGGIQTTVFLFNAKRYFMPDSAWQPYVGAGLGAAKTSITANSGANAFFGDTSGVAVHAVAGVQWRNGQFVARGEYKYLSAKTKDDSSNEINVSGNGIFVGAGFYF